MSAVPACPKYKIGEEVIYVDHQGRLQTGKVSSIQATWTPWGNGDPLIIYSLYHPTYRRNNHYAADDSIYGLA